MTIIPVDFRSRSTTSVRNCEAIATRDECIVLVRFMNAAFVSASAVQAHKFPVQHMRAARDSEAGRNTDRLPPPRTPPAAWPSFSRASRTRRRCERMRLTAASVLLSAAEWLLKLTLRFVLAGVIGRAGIRLLMEASAGLRRLSWRLWR
ncbi:hypothetical protein [Bradyrhizobium prioriisuperbiae]|uniref:hypothetical protein n=1 Tax=Bradyrhizobium prioriisuperbiae TaxID=2854389 RepID=UPI0028E66709|nr:hypothetical protein [Bradyrhizobium prioritasuperba]